MEWNDWISLGVSLLAIIGTCYTYFKHDKKIKSQETKINEYQIKQIEQEEKEGKKALIRGGIIKFDKGKRILKIYNSGKSLARNIRMEIMFPMFTLIKTFGETKYQDEFNELLDEFNIVAYSQLEYVN